MKKFLTFILIFFTVFCSTPLVQGAEQSKEPPRVISTNPANGDAEVDPTLSKITVIFDRPMLDKSWTWSQENKKSFPQVEGKPFYTENGMTCVLPVRLEPGKRYIIWINTTRFKNFKDTKGIAAEPYRIEFRTKQQGK
jgi:hypothetical protein